MTNDSLYYLKKLIRKYLVIRSGEILLLALAAACIVFGLTLMINIRDPLRMIIPAFTGTLFFVFGFFRLKLHKLNETRLITFINLQYPVMQQSMDLLFKDSVSLTSIQQIQKEKIKTQFPDIYPTIKFPHQIGKAIIFLTVSVVLTLIISSFSYNTQSGSSKESETALAHDKTAPITLHASVKEVIMKVNPPAYTGLASYSTKNPHLSLPEGSIVTWNIAFSDTIQHAQIIFLRGDSIKLTGRKNYSAKRSFTESSIYQLSWKTPSGERKSSEYYKLEILPDQSPKITVPQRPQFTEIAFNDKLSVNLKSNISDDYGLKEAYIIATVSKGSGESVKFREEKLLFTSPGKIQERNTQASRIIDLAKLGLEPGDELYFYIEALDNKIPSGNRSRTETFFIALQDTASQNFSMDAGPGVNFMPEYFRSQRQIIIDSEKLLRERKVINKASFNSRSNELGYDQKVLRIKYGEFLGEEFETSIGPGAEHSVKDDPGQGEDEEQQDPAKQYAHIHDKENEHNLVPDKKFQPGLKHDHVIESDPGKKEDPTDAYKHVHDDPEEATFFTQSIRSKLKAALTIMWDAELHLRMADPEKSLPYQYTALKLLKEISNESRIYVHKTGFDPPPLKEEKRLSGDLSDIKSSRYQRAVDNKEIYPAIRHAFGMVEERLQRSDIFLTTKDKQALLLAGKELATLSLDEPGHYLQALSRIKSLNEDQLKQKEIMTALLSIRKAFWKALPKEKVSPVKSVQSTHTLDHEFIKNLESLKNE